MIEDLTDIHVVLDRSGSMRSIEADMKGGFDSFIRSQRALPGQCRVSLYQFDTDYEVVYEAMDVQKVPALVLEPRSATALYDAVALTVQRMQTLYRETPNDQKPARVILVIITDGHENSSKEFRSPAQVKMFLDDAQRNDWQVVFLGSNIDVSQEAVNLGIKSHMTRSNVKGGDYMARNLSAAVSDYRSSAVGSASYVRGMSLSDDEEND
jgi:hypothetical protein